jgi:putative autoinducer-2 (AI-2) aldolase
MGRNIFQSADPASMIRAVSAVVHESLKPAAAHDRFLATRPGAGGEPGPRR